MFNRSLTRKTIAGALLGVALFGGKVFASGIWTQANGHWYLGNQDGTYAKGWQSVGGHWYYMENDGSMKTGWKQLGSIWYYLNPSGDMATGWKQLGNTWYYFNDDGSMATGWKQLNYAWHYLNPDKTMGIGWGYLGNHSYYFNGDGSMATGWRYINDNWYYFIDDGIMTTGWQHLDKKSYYMFPNGVMASNTTIGIYKLGADGAYIFDPKIGSVGTTPGKYAATYGSDVWIPSSGVIKTIAGISSNWTKTQLDAIAVEAPASATIGNVLDGIKLPQDGKLYHYKEGWNLGGGRMLYLDLYCMNLETVKTAYGDIRYHVLDITYSYNKITNFNVSEE